MHKKSNMLANIHIYACKNKYYIKYKFWGRKLNPIPSCMFTMSISWVPMWWLTSSHLLINDLKGHLVRLITFYLNHFPVFDRSNQPV